MVGAGVPFSPELPVPTTTGRILCNSSRAKSRCRCGSVILPRPMLVRICIVGNASYDETVCVIDHTCSFHLDADCIIVELAKFVSPTGAVHYHVACQDGALVEFVGLLLLFGVGRHTRCGHKESNRVGPVQQRRDHDPDQKGCLCQGLGSGTAPVHPVFEGDGDTLYPSFRDRS